MQVGEGVDDGQPDPPPQEMLVPCRADAGPDDPLACPDAATTAHPDAAVDGSFDAAPDGSFDAAPPDAARDAFLDGGSHD